MADTQQGVRQQSARDAAGTTDTHSGDLRALFESVATVPAGSTYNEAFMLWLQSVTGSSADNINDLAALFASQQDDTYNWSSSGPLLGLTLLYHFDASVASSITEAGTGVSEWADISDNGYLAIQGTDANRPTNTTDGPNPALLFNGTSDYLEATGLGLTATQFLTMWKVERPLTVVPGFQTDIFLSNAGTTERASMGHQSNTIRCNYNVSLGSGSVVNTSGVGADIHVTIFRNNNDTPGIVDLDDDGPFFDPNVGTLEDRFDKINIGRTAAGASFKDGYIMELGAYAQRLTDGQTVDFIDQLKTKWNIA